MTNERILCTRFFKLCTYNVCRFEIGTCTVHVYIVDYNIEYWKRTDMGQWHEDSTKSLDATHTQKTIEYTV